MTSSPSLPNVPVAVPDAWLSLPPTTQVSARDAPTRETTGVPAPRAVPAIPEGRRPRLGRTALALLHASLSQRDWKVLRVVSSHRYLSTRQVERFCFTDHATPLTAARVARRVLQRLASHRILVPLARRIGGVRAGSASYVWQVGPVGHRLLDTPGRRRAHEPSLLFLEHTLLIADLHLHLLDAHRQQRLYLESVATEPDCWTTFTGMGGAPELLKPDLAVTVTDPMDPSFVNRWLVEADRGTEHLGRLLAKCQQYRACAASGALQSGGEGFPLVLWAMNDAQRISQLQAAIANDPTLDASLFRVTLHHEVASWIAGGIQ